MIVVLLSGLLYLLIQLFVKNLEIQEKLCIFLSSFRESETCIQFH